MMLFKVIAEDQGTPNYRASADVTIIIEDANDCHPKFSHPQYHLNVDEDEPALIGRSYRQHTIPKKLVGSVHATDCDIGQNALIQYYFAQTDIPFEVSEHLGQIKKQFEKMHGNVKWAFRALQLNYTINIT